VESIQQISIHAKAMLSEIHYALEKFAAKGQNQIFFLNKMPLTIEDRGYIKEFLGSGSIRINLTDCPESVEWLESGIPGVWYGVYYNHIGKPIVETIEVCAFPQLAKVQHEDVSSGLNKLGGKLADLL